MKFALAVVLSACAGSAAGSAAKPPDRAPPAEDLAFPSGWQGTWRGPLRMLAGANKDLAMELHIQPLAADRWTFKLVYDGQPRDYVLIAKDLAKGEFVVDEGNSIVIDARLVDGTLFSQFSVSNNFVAIRYTRRAGALDFEVVMVDAKSPNKTGGGSGAPDVLSFPVKVLQRAQLVRAKP
jgi:hypothetical protein